MRWMETTRRTTTRQETNTDTDTKSQHGTTVVFLAPSLPRLALPFPSSLLVSLSSIHLAIPATATDMM